jgi:hypothetical protein
MPTFEEVDACLVWLNRNIANHVPSILASQFKEEDRLSMINGLLETAEQVREATEKEK